MNTIFGEQTAAPMEDDVPANAVSIQEADQLFREAKIEQAIKLYQQIIEQDLQLDYKIDGVGNHAQMLGYYEWFVPRWYDQNRKLGKLRGTPYDALALCYSSLKNNEQLVEKGVAWYRRMKRKSQNYQVMMGCGHILYKKGTYEEAIRMYRKVIEMRPQFEPPYQCIALIYQYKRVQKRKAIEMANKLLDLNPKNLWALFVIARNQKDVDDKIAKLKQLHQIHPKYARAVNETGIAYGGTKKLYDEAIGWYKKCIEIVPEYASCYNNVGVNYQLKKEFETALDWYFKAMEKDPEYKAPHKNATDIFDELSYTDEQITELRMKYAGVQEFFFKYYMGLSYYDKKKYNISIKWYNAALQIPNAYHYKVQNSMGISYDDLKQYDKAEEYYKKCIEASPKYHSAYYNLAIVYKSRGNQQGAIQWYRKAIEVNPSYSYAYNNLGNIYKNRGDYEDAIICYKQAVQHLSTYTLAYANLGVCYLKMQNYPDAFVALQRAKQILPSDNNNLSSSNKSFLRDTLARFDKEGQKWRNSPYISKEQKNNLNNLLSNFESNFISVYGGDIAKKVHDSKVLKKQVIQIIGLVFQDKLRLQNLSQLYPKLRKLFFTNQEYFHILPQLITQHYWQALSTQAKTSEVQQILVKGLDELISAQIDNIEEQELEDLDETLELKHFKSTKGIKFNLLYQPYYKTYEELFREIDKVNSIAREQLHPFTELVEEIKEKGNGIPEGVNMLVAPNNPTEDFRQFMQFFISIFEEQLTPQRQNNIRQEIDAQLLKFEFKHSPNVIKVNTKIADVWSRHVTQMLQEREERKEPIIFSPSDLIKGTISFHKVHDLFEAVEIAEEVCCKKGYEIVELVNRLTNSQMLDMILTIRVGKTACELRLAIKKDERPPKLVQLMQSLKNSPLGIGFASYLTLSKRVNYPIKNNCRDILQRLGESENPKDRKTLEAATFLLDCLPDDDEQ